MENNLRHFFAQINPKTWLGPFLFGEEKYDDAISCLTMSFYIDSGYFAIPNQPRGAFRCLIYLITGRY